MRLVDVSFPRSPLKPLTYSIPEGFPDLSEGARVLVPVGPRFTSGFVTRSDVSAKDTDGIRAIADVLDKGTLFSDSIVRLTRWMSEYYLADWADLLKSALPPAMDVRPETMVVLTAEGQSREILHPILQLLQQKRNLPLKEIYKLFGHKRIFFELRSLEEAGLIEIVAERKSRRRRDNMIELLASAPVPEKEKERLLYDALSGYPGGLPLEQLQKDFKNLPALVRGMKSKGIVRTYWLPGSALNEWPSFTPVEKMNSYQQRAFEKVQEHLGSFRVFLLHGVTGSGKTEVYLRIAREVLNRGNSVLMLVPEIALLPLFARRAQQALDEPASILHSELAERDRLEEWQKARSGKVRVVIGTRSAIFAPLPNLGLIVMDEEHDGSYKQGEYPRYHARESAIMRAHFENCPIVLGSATPSIESFFNAGSGKFEYLSLASRVEDRPMPRFHLIDMKEEYRETGDAVFSRVLLQLVRDRLEKKEQVLILQNRRGYASQLMCRDCGNVLECPNCSITLTYHKVARRMRCHYCDYSRLAPSKCEKCGSIFMHLYGVGTEKIAEAMKHLFPEARIERFDRDATRKRGSIDRILTRFAHHEIDVLVGTQMLAKGHDFHNITLVGVVGADSAIGIPDFRASERLFQLITQVSGRSGRGMQPGIVVLQTYHPDHYAIRASINQSYRDFYEMEIRFRRLMRYPPYLSLANIVFSGKDAKKVVDECREFAKLILVFKTEPMKILGPAIAPIARLSGLYRFQLLIKSPARKDLHECLRAATDRFGSQDSKRHSQFSIDIDPYSIA
jgi:primosomal protein N' (replication factor Y)